MHAATFARTTPLHADDGRAARSPHPSRPDRQASASTAIAGIGTAGRCAQHMGILQDRADVAPCRRSLQATCRVSSAEAPRRVPTPRGRALPHRCHPVAIRRPPARNAPVERELASLTPTSAGRTDRLDAGRFQRVVPATGSCAPGGYRQRIETAQHHVVAEPGTVIEPPANTDPPTASVGYRGHRHERWGTRPGDHGSAYLLRRRLGCGPAGITGRCTWPDA